MSTVLVIDDQDLDRKIAVDIVNEMGHTAIPVNSAEEGIRRAKETKPSLILMDVVMKDQKIDGYGACKQIKSDEVTKNIPVIFVTTKGTPVDKMWALKQGGVDLVAKKYTPDQLKAVIKKHLI